MERQAHLNCHLVTAQTSLIMLFMGDQGVRPNFKLTNKLDIDILGLIAEGYKEFLWVLE